MTLQAFGTRVVVKPEVKEAKTTSGILLQPQKEQKTTIGRVVNTGSKATEAKAGDRVMFHQYAGSEIEHEGEVYLIIEIRDIIGVLDEDAIPTLTDSEKEKDRKDLIQPYTADGKPNAEFTRVYGSDAIEKFESAGKNTGSKVEGKMQEMDERANYKRK